MDTSYGLFCLADREFYDSPMLTTVEDAPFAIVGRELPPGIELPAFLAPHLEARNSDTLGDLPYRPEQALHFSNGGGVYLGVDTRTGEQIVLKEARPHAGRDRMRGSPATSAMRWPASAASARRWSGLRGSASLRPCDHFVAERVFAEREGSLLVIAHRISSALRARRVLVLDSGSALAGRHDDLLARSPLYRDLVGHWNSAPSTAPAPANGRSQLTVREALARAARALARRRG